MREATKWIWHVLRDHATHWMIGGAILTLTGFAPEEWLAYTAHGLHIPAESLHLWTAGIDARIVTVAAGMAIIGFGLLRQRRSDRSLPVNGPSGLLHSTTVTDRAQHAAAPQSVGTTNFERTRESLPPPDRPSIAVLPFANLSGDPEQEYFSDGVANDIITELSRDRALLVIARNSSFTYRGRAVDVKRVGQELGVRYVVEGSVRREAGRVRITAQLIDAANGSHIWAERCDRALEHVFAVQDEITNAVVMAIEPAISQAEIRRALRKTPGNLDAWEAHQRGMWYLAKASVEGNRQASHFFEQSIALDPTFATSHAMLGYVHIWEINFGRVHDIQAQMNTGEIEARRAIELDPSDAIAHAVLALAVSARGQHDRAMEHAERALAISPNSVTTLLAMGRILEFSGRAHEAQAPLLNALRRSPHDPLVPQVLLALAISHYFTRDYAAAEVVARRAVNEFPAAVLTHRWLAAALGQQGSAEAAEALRQAIEISPSVFEFFVR